MPVVSGDGKLGFMPYRSYHGRFDEMLGISMFWSEKFMIFVMYVQRFALLMLWSLNWPTLFYSQMQGVFGVLLDFTAHHTSTNAIGKGTIFEGCEAICKFVWPIVCLPILLAWSCLTLQRTWPMYYTRNVERILWTFVRVGLLPFMNTLLRYFVLNEDGNLDAVTWTWTTPVSEIGVFFAFVTLFTFLVVAYRRCRRNVLFRSRIRHDAFIRARELEYKLKFSTTYRNERIWMISSFNYAAWPWSIIRGMIDMVLLALMAFAPVKGGIITGNVILGLNFLYGFILVDLHRCTSSNIIEHIFNAALFVFSLIGVFQAFGLRNPLLVDQNLDYFLFGLNGGALAIALLLCVYFFYDAHKFGRFSVADRRAQKKWALTFGLAGGSNRGGTWVSMASKKSRLEGEEGEEEEEERREEMDEDLEKEAFVKENRKASAANLLTQQEDTFYLPKEATFFSLNCASPHVWPVNGVVINELLRRNMEDHLIDVLRAARKMVDRISALHNTPVLIPTDEMKTHITRLQNCLQICKRQRITHHVNAIHPLQTTFEDLIEQFTFELRVFNGRTITVGHNARKMIEVSRYLRKRMLVRDRALALVSPLMRRVLIKLMALRIFIELVEDRPSYLLPQQQTEKPFADDASSSASSDAAGAKEKKLQNEFGEGLGEELVVNAPLDEGLGGEEEQGLASQLAAAVHQQHEKTE